MSPRPKTTKPIEIKEKIQFGQYVEHFLFAVQTPLSFFNFTDDLAHRTGARFTMVDDFVQSGDKMQAHFKMAYTQFDGQLMEQSFFENTVDKLNLVVFQNSTSNFIKPVQKTVNKTPSLFDEIEEDERCFALSNKGLCLQRWKYGHADYFVMFFSRPNSKAPQFADYLSTFPYNMRNLTSILKGETKQSTKNDQEKSYTSVPASTKLIQSIFSHADLQIGARIRRRKSFEDGIVPDSLKPYLFEHILIRK